MGLAITIISVLLQGVAAALALRLAWLSQRIFLLPMALAVVLMATRRAYSMFGSIVGEKPINMGTELIAVIISAMMVVGLIGCGRFLRQKRLGEAEKNDPRVNGSSRRGLSRTALFLGTISIFACAVIGYSAYQVSRDIVLQTSFEEARQLARMFRNRANDHQEVSQDEMVILIDAWWGHFCEHHLGMELLVYDNDGNLMSSPSRHQESDAEAKSTVPLDWEKLMSVAGPSFRSEIQDWAGWLEDRSGAQYLASVSTLKTASLTLVVLMPRSQVDRHVLAEQMPWVGGMLLVAGVLLPLALGLSHWAYASAEAQQARVTHAMRGMERRYSALEEISPVGIFYTDALGNCRHVNDRWCEIAGLSADEAMGDGWIEAIHPEDRDRLQAEWYEAAKAGVLFVSEYRFEHADGRLCWVVGQAVRETSPSGKTLGYIGTVTDITERKEAEMQTRVRTKHKSIVARLSQHALQGVPLHELFAEATEYLTSTLGVAHADLLEYLPKSGSFSLCAGAGWESGFVGRVTVGAPTDSWAGFLSQTRSPLIVDDWSAEKRFPQPLHLRDHQVVSSASVPVFAFGPEEVFGILGIHTSGAHPFTEEEMAFLQALSGVLGTAIERQIAEDRLLVSEERHRRMATSLQILLDELDHRVKNNLSGLIALVSMIESVVTTPEQFANSIRQRLVLMNTIHEMLAGARWQAVDLKSLIMTIAERLWFPEGMRGRISLEGPNIDVPPRQAGPLGLLLNELYANARQYGGLQGEEGDVLLVWQVEPSEGTFTQLVLNWVERGGTPVQEPPEIKGIGLDLVRGLARFELGGEARVEFDPEGLRCSVKCSIETPREHPVPASWRDQMAELAVETKPLTRFRSKTLPPDA